jgi:hypothetical protein
VYSPELTKKPHRRVLTGDDPDGDGWVVSGASEGDLQVFLHYAQRAGLDPFARQFYMIGRNDRQPGGKKWTIQASIDGLRIVAQRSGEYAGQVGPEWWVRTVSGET